MDSCTRNRVGSSLFLMQELSSCRAEVNSWRVSLTVDKSIYKATKTINSISGSYEVNTLVSPHHFRAIGFPCDFKQQISLFSKLISVMFNYRTFLNVLNYVFVFFTQNQVLARIILGCTCSAWNITLIILPWKWNGWWWMFLLTGTLPPMQNRFARHKCYGSINGSWFISINITSV